MKRTSLLPFWEGHLFGTEAEILSALGHHQKREMGRENPKKILQNEVKTGGTKMRAEIYESVDKMKNGGTLHTLIYCFQTDKPILGEDCSVNKDESKATKDPSFLKRLFHTFF